MLRHEQLLSQLVTEVLDVHLVKELFVRIELD